MNPSPLSAEVIGVAAARPSASDTTAQGPIAHYRPAQAGALGLASYLRWIPRTSSRLRLGVVCWLLRRFVRLQVGSAADVLSLRAKLLRLDRRLFHMPSGARRTPAGLPGVAAESVEADGCSRERVLLYLHGGAFAFHLPTGYGAFAAHLSQALDARVVLVDYRLAPEHPFPAPQEDCLNAYRQLLAQGVSAQQIVVAGDSAGGNLTLGLLQRLVREGLPQPACAVALSPAADITLTGETLHTLAAEDPMLPVQSLHVFRDLAFAPQHRSDATASPLHGDPAQTAPTLVMAGTREVLLDDACRFAQRAHEAGGCVRCEIWQDMPHVFPLLSQLKESRLAMRHIAQFVEAVAGWSTPAGRTVEPADRSH
jgi:acetyl esterase/lipase